MAAFLTIIHYRVGGILGAAVYTDEFIHGYVFDSSGLEAYSRTSFLAGTPDAFRKMTQSTIGTISVVG